MGAYFRRNGICRDKVDNQIIQLIPPTPGFSKGSGDKFFFQEYSLTTYRLSRLQLQGNHELVEGCHEAVRPGKAEREGRF